MKSHQTCFIIILVHTGLSLPRWIRFETEKWGNVGFV